jgi:hypothetical protein
MLAARGAVTTVMDEVMIHNRELARAISGAESAAARSQPVGLIPR